MKKKYALCVGINNYPGTASDLYGCVNDAVDWAELFSSQGYQVMTIFDGAADKATILSQLEEMVAKTGFGDRLVFQFSGHGTWVPDYDGDEIDKRDEALCAVDYERGGLITDDELYSIFGSRLRHGAGALMISDSCHSGTLARFASTKNWTGARFISPADFTDMTKTYAADVEKLTDAKPRKSASLISGCMDIEYSYDANFAGRPNGALSRTAINAYTPGITLNDWYLRIRETLPLPQYPQTPQLSASTYRKYAKAL